MRRGARAARRAPEAEGYKTCLSLSTLRSRSIPTRYLLRNLCPTMPPSWKPSSALGARRFSTTTGKFRYWIWCRTPDPRPASGTRPDPSPTSRRPSAESAARPAGRSGRAGVAVAWLIEITSPPVSTTKFAWCDPSTTPRTVASRYSRSGSSKSAGSSRQVPADRELVRLVVDRSSRSRAPAARSSPIPCTGMSRSGGFLMRHGTLRSLSVPISSESMRASCRPRRPTSPTPALSV